jgi:MFS family permease
MTPSLGPFVRSDRAAAWVLAIGALDFGLEQFIILPLLPAIQSSEGASITAATWLVTGFLLAAVAAAPVFGRLGDMYGKRRLLLVAVALFVAGSLICAVSDSITGLIAGRVVQGMGAGLGPLAIGIARDRAPRGRAPVWIGLLIAVAGAGAAVGLLLGGILADHASIAAVFWVLFGLGVVLFACVLIFVPETPAHGTTRPDWIGGLLLASALVTFLLPVSEANRWGWTSAEVLGLMALSVILLLAFVAFERRCEAPMVDMQLLSRRPAWSANLAAFAIGFAFFTAGVMIPRIATLPTASGYGFGLSYAETGLVLVPGALAIVAGAWSAGLLIPRIGARILVGCGALSAAMGYALLAFEHGSVAAVVVGNVPVGLGIGLAVASLTNLVVGSVDDTKTSAFAATTAVSRSVGAALGTQIAAAVVISAGVVGGYPAERGFTGAFVLGLIATLVALAATIAVPARSTDPLISREPVEVTIGGYDELVVSGKNKPAYCGFKNWLSEGRERRDSNPRPPA